MKLTGQSVRQKTSPTNSLDKIATRQTRKEFVDVGTITFSQFSDLMFAGEDNVGFDIVPEDRKIFEDFLKQGNP